LETARELDSLLQQAHRQEQDNPDARVVYKQVIRTLQEIKDPIDLINIKEQLAERYNSVLKYLKEINVSKENKKTHEDIQNFKGCVEYFSQNIKTFLDEKKFYTACKLSEELAYRIKMAKSIDDNVFINIDNRLKDIEFRYNDYSREISEAATLEKKKPNEDAYFANDEYRVRAVFDGVTGKRGGSGGHLASAIAVDYLRQSLTRLSDDLRVEDMQKNMKDILFGMHNKITQCKYGNYSEMATTASVVKVMKDGTAIIGNVGDSRVYLLKSENPSVEQLTLDHAGWVEEVKNEGHNPWAVQKAMADAQNPRVPSNQIPEICTDPDYLSITQCLGYGDIRPDIYTRKLNPGDILIITSDGAHDNLTDENMAKLLENKSNPKEAADALVQEAKKISTQKTPRSKADDITAVVYVHGKGGDVEEIESERLEEGR
jgi:protein phosphatase